MGEGRKPYQIRAAYREEWQEAIALAWRTFLRYEAQDYKQEGMESFREFITDTALYQMFLAGSYKMFVALENGRITGMITLRATVRAGSIDHISLLFVEGSCHHRGIGSALVKEACRFLAQERRGIKAITVNSSPYAAGFYHKIGFHNTGEETKEDGIIYTPMEYTLTGYKAAPDHYKKGGD